MKRAICKSAAQLLRVFQLRKFVSAKKKSPRTVRFKGFSVHQAVKIDFAIRLAPQTETQRRGFDLEEEVEKEIFHGAHVTPAFSGDRGGDRR